MDNSRLDFYTIFEKKMSRKLHKGRISNIKYFDKPYPSIKHVKDVM